MKKLTIDCSGFQDVSASVGGDLVYIEQGGDLFCLPREAAAELGRFLADHASSDDEGEPA